MQERADLRFATPLGGGHGPQQHDGWPKARETLTRTLSGLDEEPLQRLRVQAGVQARKGPELGRAPRQVSEVARRGPLQAWPALDADQGLGRGIAQLRLADPELGRGVRHLPDVCAGVL